jgi:mannose-6-phosphate isomerase-like protein (cupin superfamily)
MKWAFWKYCNLKSSLSVSSCVRRIQLHQARAFKILAQTRISQAAEMVIRPGDSEGGPGNKHASDQWLYVTDGRGTAIVEGRTTPLRKGMLLLIEKGETHEIRAGGKTPLRSLNLYAPPAY